MADMTDVPQDAGLTRKEPEQDRGGEWVPLGPNLYRIPPLSFRALRDLQSDLAELSKIEGLPTPAQMDVMVRILHAAVARNYPSMSTNQLEDLIDIGNFGYLFSAVMRIAGVKATKPGEVGAHPSTGTGSTAS